MDELPGKSNYFIGNNPNEWRTDLPNYAKVKYSGIYSGVDLIYYGNQGRLEYDFVLAPGVDPKSIKLSIAGDDAMLAHVDRHGDLVLTVHSGTVRFHKPMVYQSAVENGRDTTVKAFVNARYVISNKRQVTFAIAHYDRTKPLVIDPVLSYSSYLGGSESDAGNSIVVDTNGDAYVTGWTNSSDFPTTIGSYANSCRGCTGNTDAFVTKLNRTGSALIYSTYLGGSTGNGTVGNGIAVDAADNTYITGITYSPDFPTTLGAVQVSCPVAGPRNECYSAFVTKLDPSGSALGYSTFLGGSGGSAPDVYTAGSGIAVDSAGNAYVTGETTSTGFPTTLGAFQTSCAGSAFECNDAFVTKVNSSGTALIYSTYLGGQGSDGGLAITLNSAGNAYIAGATYSTDFPIVNPIRDACVGSCGTGSGFDAFVTEINAAGSGLVYSTYLGGSSDDIARALAADASGDIYVTGSTCSGDFPTSHNAFQSSYGGGCSSHPGDAFVTKLNPTGSALIYSTYLGGGSSDVAQSIVVDVSGNAYLAGFTNSPDFPTTVGAVRTNRSSGTFDAFLAELNMAGSTLIYSTYLGGSGGAIAASIALDSSRDVYVTGWTYSSDFPTTAGAIQKMCGGGLCVTGDAFVTKLTLPGDNTPPTTSAAALPSPNRNGWNDTNVTVTLNAADNPGGSGVKQIQFAMGGAQNTGLQTVAGSTASITITSQGTTILSYFGTDNAGNQEATATLTVRIDKTPPVITPIISGTVGNNNWYTSNVVVSWSVTDPESGIASSTDCGPTNLTSDTVGAALTCMATNGAGLSFSVTVTVKIDKTSPIIVGMPPAGCTLRPPNGELIGVAVVKASDALSGLAPGSFSVTGTSNEPSDPNDPEIVITSNGSGGFIVQLQADRLSTGAGRIYTLTAVASDLAGNQTTATAACVVPRDHEDSDYILFLSFFYN